MGTTDSKQKLGERVIAARKKLSDDLKIQSERAKDIESQSPETMKVVMQSVAESFKSCSPFLEPTLLIAWQSNPEECQKIILNSCARVLSAPIHKDEYKWFSQYVFPSSIWMFKSPTNQNRYMYQELMDICNGMQKHIVDSMNKIYNHLEYHPEWKQLLDIKNETIVSRQDDNKVGLLQEKGIKNISEMKQIDDKSDDLQTFVDSNLAINILTTTAKNINQEFQNHIKTVMSHYGDFKPGPTKKVERCLSKLENDYQDAEYPKAAKLLDLVRCSITFNTVDQLIAGYRGLKAHITKNPQTIELARIKNGFLDKTYMGGYRDIKVNVIYHSAIDPNLTMICEVQLLLGQYLHEKKRIHKLYNIIRQELYFRMTVTEDDEKQLNSKDVTDLKFEPVLNVENVQGTSSLSNNGKCSVDSDLGLLAIESETQISCLDVQKKKMIFTESRGTGSFLSQNLYSHSWVIIDQQKYLSVQLTKNMIKFYKIKQVDNKTSFIEEKQLEICLGENDTINCCEFDKAFENIIIVKNGKVLEKRAVKNSNNVLISIQLKQEIKPTNVKILSLSNDGNWCVVGGGRDIPFFYLIEITKKKQYKVTSTNLKSSYSPCFVNGNPEFCMVGGKFGKIEVWDVKKRVSIKVLELKANERVVCLTSANNILAVGSNDKKLSLWDTKKWQMFWSEQYRMFPTSVHLTNDSKYLTIGGWYGEKCVILGIK